MKTDIFKDENILKLSDSIASFIEYWGFKGVQGKIWFLLFITDKSFSTKELREIFNVSKGSMSTFLNELLDYKVIEFSGNGKYGVELFKANENLLEAIFFVLKNRELKILKQVSVDIDRVISLNLAVVSKDRLVKVQRMTNYAESTLSKFLELGKVSWIKWRDFTKKS